MHGAVEPSSRRYSSLCKEAYHSPWKLFGGMEAFARENITKTKGSIYNGN